MRKNASLTEKALICGMHKRVPARILSEKWDQAIEVLNEMMKAPEIGQEIPVELKVKAMALLWLNPQTNSVFK